MVRNQVDIVDLSVDTEGRGRLQSISSKPDNRIWAIIKNRNQDTPFNSIEV
jgi:hypothetical protein